jgi:hypothetical protein
VKLVSISARDRAPALVSVTLACSAALLSGCMSSPTYGTGKTANAQLVEDLSNILSPGFGNDGPEIAYTPRGDLVQPASTAVLPTPQQDIASADNPAWPESPEERRARIRAEATENRGNANYRSPVTSAGFGQKPINPNMGIGSPEELAAERADARSSLTGKDRAEMERRLRERNQGNPNARAYLSEPPIEYRRPAEGAPVGELGVDEWKKERELQRASGKKSWRDYVPWL